MRASSPVRVAYLLDPVYEGGAERYLLRLAGGLDRSVFQPVWILPDRPDLAPLAERAAAAGVDVLPYSRGRSGSALRAARPRLVHLNLPSTYDLACGFEARRARAAGARAVVSTEHIVDIAVSRRRGLMKRLALGWIDRVIAISEAHRRILAGRHGVPAEKIRLILNGVEDPGTAETRPEPHPLRIVAVGALENRKGPDLLVEAFAALLAAGLEAELVLVGDGLEKENLKRQARSRGVEGSVTFMGRLDSAWPELRKADIIAVPSRIEGIPFAVLEGLAVGRPVVAAALPGIEEVIESERNGLVVPPDDVPALAAALSRLAGDSAMRKRLGRAAREAYEKRFTLERMVSETETLYREVLA